MPSRYISALNEKESAIIKDLKAYINLIVKESEVRIMNNVFDALDDIEEINTNDFRNIYKNNNRTLSETSYSSSSRASSPPQSPKNNTRAGKKNKKKNKTKRKF